MLNAFVRVLGLASLLPAAWASAEQRPIYAIAHRVLRNSSVTNALSHGANALEVDLTAWNVEWWADHDGTANSAGTTAREIFTFIAEQREAGQDVSFVWLDIKNPDYCETGRDCSIETLRDLVRQTLEPAGVQALYGFFQTADSRGYGVIQDSLNPNEAICLNGEANEVLEAYDSTGAAIPIAQRVMDYGWVQLDQGFGTCHEETYQTCTELRQGAEARDQGKLGKVFSWTSTDSDTERVQQLLGEASIDGIIYGYQNADYDDNEVPRAAGQDIIDYVRENPETLRMATGADAPW